MKISLKQGVALAMVLSSAMMSSAHALTVYTAGPGSLAKGLASGFEKKTGVKVDIFQATTGKVMARLEAEQANPQADILISASWDTAEDLHNRGWLLPYQSANAEKVPEMLKSTDYVAQGVSALGIVWNTKSGTPEPKEWKDLTAAAFKDKVTTPDPALSGASLDLLIGLQNGMGEGAWTLFDELKKNGMVVSGPNAQAVTPVMQGAKAAVFGAVDYVTYGNIEQGESLKVIFPASGTVIAPRPMMILKSTQHEADAKAFVDYVLSPEGQKLVADAWLMPARTDVQAKRPLFNELKILPTKNDGTSERGAVLKRFNTLFAQ
ncbi:ABC transporter substrate-binding protein [Phytobacter diazotrophicus]|uniref:ABC transporter substrate-binding protein n=1 Tax=Citrobacter bitternis TaxID=1585982 RepID=A0ABW1PWJ3_9ENTR|nr:MULTISPECIES: ABC transporter substrate-binding protein [Enterobacteriaceae]MDU7132766.1 ABC transporter substrate-binding protein [Enterobacteriaceae bacterium]QIH63634.1 ABC transporter substrate-binding protein [Enterobacteriaceae bacterium A-F18]MBY6256566.1 ABC transporter substrate-binding protein [Phytobacter diazotrophicus]MDU4352551.1 ABC transporter substrate-binding protein [Phytobacter diazotrophicus]QOV71129.1 ABC transporter substrate-binding protein [Citrobacter sp. BDA59-3]